MCFFKSRNKFHLKSSAVDFTVSPNHSECRYTTLWNICHMFWLLGQCCDFYVLPITQTLSLWMHAWTECALCPVCSRHCKSLLFILAVNVWFPISIEYTFLPTALWHCWLGIRKSIWSVKIEWWGVGVVICLEQGADCLHMVQLMPLHPKTASSLASVKSRLV